MVRTDFAGFGAIDNVFQHEWAPNIAREAGTLEHLSMQLIGGEREEAQRLP